MGEIGLMVILKLLILAAIGLKRGGNQQGTAAVSANRPESLFRGQFVTRKAVGLSTTKCNCDSITWVRGRTILRKEFVNRILWPP